MISIGSVYGRLTVIKPMDDRLNSRTKWECRCECGNVTYPTSNCLKRDNSRSCGCMRRESMREAGKSRRVHGGYGGLTYSSWTAMKARCYNQNTPNYKDYGGRGIRVCNRWLTSFEAFREDMGERPGKEYSIERDDVDGDYDPSNCRWATREEQSNNKRNNVFYTVDGVRMHLGQIAKKFNIPRPTLESRLIRDGMTIEEAIAKVAKRYLVTHKGETMTIGEWSKKLGVPDSRLRYLINRGVPFELAILAAAK